MKILYLCATGSASEKPLDADLDKTLAEPVAHILSSINFSLSEFRSTCNDRLMATGRRLFLTEFCRR